MRRFLYYFPKLSGINPQMLADRGLLSRFTGAGGKILDLSIAHLGTGPAGAGSGCLVAAGSPAQCHPSQTWFEGEQFWVGIENSNEPPRPADLARPVAISGYEWELGDANRWRIPLLRKWDRAALAHTPNLPQAMTPVLHAGKYRYENRVLPRYAEAHALGERIVSAFAAEAKVSFAALLTDAAAVLAVNYRVGVEECGLLGLFEEQTALETLMLAIDYPALREHGRELMMAGLEQTGGAGLAESGH